MHCGEDCGKFPVIWSDKPFCCEGCKTVYMLLNEKQLGRYYEFEKMSGVKIEDENIHSTEKYTFLDLPEIQKKLLDFLNNEISRVRFFIPSIHCASCIWLLENLHSLHSGVIQSSVDFPRKEITITFRNSEITLRKLVELLASIHYIPEITPQTADKKRASKVNKTLLIKIGIAGFSFMNAMLYHFPQYLPGNEYLEDNFRLVFGWLSFVLALPVMFYCASDYFLSAYKSLRKRIISIDLPIAVGLITLFIQSLIEIMTDAGIGYIDSLTGLVFFLLVGKWYQGKTYQALSFERDYRTYFPVAVTKVVDGKNVTIPLEKLKKGDRILVRNQELIPADGIIISGNVNIDYSFVTGESIPSRKEIGDFVFAGGKQVGESIELIVEKEVEQSYLTQLWNQENKKNTDTHSIKNTVNKVSQYFTLTIFAVALSAGVFWFFTNPDKAVFAFTSVLIIACPCALALTIPFTFGSTMRQFGRRGFYLKNTDVIEELKSITTIVFDKTGTITYSRSSKVEFEGKVLTDDEKVILKSLAKHSTHPMSKIIFENVEQEETKTASNYKEIAGLGISGTVDEVSVMLGSKYFISGKKQEGNIETSQVWINIGGKVKGFFTVKNVYRKGLAELIEQLNKEYELHLISGDNEAEMKNLEPLFSTPANLNFNQSPTDKLNYVRNLQNKGKKVLMIGDGLNDAGALYESNAGIVIADDIYNFSPACDAILKSSKFQNLAHFLQFSKKSMQVVKISFAISFLYNIVGMVFAVQGILSPIIAAILMPLSSVSVVVFATFAVSFLAQKSDL